MIAIWHHYTKLFKSKIATFLEAKETSRSALSLLTQQWGLFETLIASQLNPKIYPIPTHNESQCGTISHLFTLNTLELKEANKDSDNSFHLDVCKFLAQTYARSSLQQPYISHLINFDTSFSLKKIHCHFEITYLKCSELEWRLRLEYSILIKPSLWPKILGISAPEEFHSAHRIRHVAHYMTFLYFVSVW